MSMRPHGVRSREAAGAKRALTPPHDLPVPPPPGTAVLRASLQRASQKAEHATLRAASYVETEPTARRTILEKLPCAP